MYTTQATMWPVSPARICPVDLHSTNDVFPNSHVLVDLALQKAEFFQNGLMCPLA